MVEALMMPLALASWANWLFQPSKPAAELPHCAASACELKGASIAKIKKVALVNCLLLVIRKFPCLAAAHPHRQFFLAAHQPGRNSARHDRGSTAQYSHGRFRPSFAKAIHTASGGLSKC